VLVRSREVKGVGRLKTIARDWYAFTNLELAIGIGPSREIDVIIVADHMIFLVDLKDRLDAIELGQRRAGGVRAIADQM
jgi:hypothetical protein